METSRSPAYLSFDALDMSAVRALSCSIGLVAVVALNFLLAGGHDEQRALQVIFLLVFALALLVRGNATHIVCAVGPGPRYALFGFFLVGAVSSMASSSPRHAFYEWSSLLLLSLLSLAVAREVTGNRGARAAGLVHAVGLSCLLYAFKIIVVYISALALGNQPGALDFSPGFSNYRFLNHTQTLTLPLLILLGLLAPQRAMWRWTWFAVAALWWALLCVTAARGTVVGLVAGCAVALVLRRGHALVFLRAMVATAVAGAVLYFICFYLIPRAAGLQPFGELGQVVARTAADPASGRMLLWARAADLIVGNPWLGVGPLHFAHHAADLQIGAHPHDWVLQVAAEWGLPALFAFCCAIAYAARALLRCGTAIQDSDARNQHMLVAWIVAGAAVLADGLFSGLLVMPQSQLLIALYLGCAAGWSRSFVMPQPVEAALSLPSRVVIAIVLLAAIASLANGVYPEIVRRVNQEPLSEQESALNKSVSWPRLWLAGYF